MVDLGGRRTERQRTQRLLGWAGAAAAVVLVVGFGINAASRSSESEGTSASTAASDQDVAGAESALDASAESDPTQLSSGETGAATPSARAATPTAGEAVFLGSFANTAELQASAVNYANADLAEGGLAAPEEDQSIEVAATQDAAPPPAGVANGLQECPNAVAMVDPPRFTAEVSGRPAIVGNSPATTIPPPQPNDAIATAGVWLDDCTPIQL